MDTLIRNWIWISEALISKLGSTTTLAVMEKAKQCNSRYLQTVRDGIYVILLVCTLKKLYIKQKH